MLISMLFWGVACEKETNNDDDKPKEEEVIKNEIATYTDIEFSIKDGSETFGRLFSTEKGKMYLDSEAMAQNGAAIDIVFTSRLGFVIQY